MTDGWTNVVYTDATACCVEACRFVDVSMLAACATVTGQQPRDDDDIGADDDAERQHVRAPVDVRVVRRQNTTTRNITCFRIMSTTDGQKLKIFD